MVIMLRGLKAKRILSRRVMGRKDIVASDSKFAGQPRRESQVSGRVNRAGRNSTGQHDDHRV